MAAVSRADADEGGGGVHVPLSIYLVFWWKAAQFEREVWRETVFVVLVEIGGRVHASQNVNNGGEGFNEILELFKFAITPNTLFNNNDKRRSRNCITTTTVSKIILNKKTKEE